MVEPLGYGRYRIVWGGQVRLAYAVPDRGGWAWPGAGPSTSLGAGRTWVFIEGRTYVVEGEDRDGRNRVPRTDLQLALSAPMPATVIAVKVAPGQEVTEGDLLITLEAMKMELPIKAPHAGRVKSIACREGELVQAGVPLLELE